MLERISIWLDELHISCLEHQKNLENLGFVSDREKLIILKQQLYCMARTGENTADLRRSIDCLTESTEAESRKQNSFLNQFSGITNSLILIALTATTASYLLSGTTCKHTNSQFCRDASVIPSVISDYFNDSK